MEHYTMADVEDLAKHYRAEEAKARQQAETLEGTIALMKGSKVVGDRHDHGGFIVGDRIRVVEEDFGSDLNGESGEVVKINVGYMWPIDVVMDGGGNGSFRAGEIELAS